jgi:hypothetical protein
MASHTLTKTCAHGTLRYTNLTRVLVVAMADNSTVSDTTTITTGTVGATLVMRDDDSTNDSTNWTNTTSVYTVFLDAPEVVESDVLYTASSCTGTGNATSETFKKHGNMTPQSYGGSKQTTTLTITWKTVAGTFSPDGSQAVCPICGDPNLQTNSAGTKVFCQSCGYDGDASNPLSES